MVHLGWVQLLGTVEPSLWKPTAAIWAVCGQWMAGSLLQHVWPDMEPARIRNGVSPFLFPLLSEIQLRRKTPSASLFSHSHNFWLLLLCVFSGSLSHRAGWEGLGRSLLRLQPHRVQSCPTWAATTWQGIKHSEPGGKPRGFFLFSVFFFF